MIEAVIKNKSKRWFAKGVKTPTECIESKIPREDEVTSTIFGAMKYFNSMDIFRLFNSVSADNDLRVPLSMSVELWPKSYNLKHRNHVEPDAIISFLFAKNEKKTFILEVKWLDYEYSENQLEDQWAAFGEADPTNTRLIYLSNNSTKFNKFKSHKNKNWKAITWNEFSTILSTQLCHDSRTSSFFRDVHQMLSMFNTDHFKGFSDFQFPKNNIKELSLKLLNFKVEFGDKLDVEWRLQ
ncbi:hypothetical protein AAAA28_20530 [Providencia stuartii]|uniref:hypothetical protein n=1 Tax=Providencia stuartii TaxID=588 RepID=UPI0030F131F9